MKWISIDKAKPVFNKDYLIFSEEPGFPIIAQLLRTERDATGIKHVFNNAGATEYHPTHVALITKPSADKQS